MRLWSGWRLWAARVPSPRLESPSTTIGGRERQHASVQLRGVVVHQQLVGWPDGVLPVPGAEAGSKVELYLTDVQAGTDAVHRVQRGVHDDQLLWVDCWNQVDWTVTSRCSWDSFLYVLLIMCGD